jgi:hypothetical protein
VSPDYVSLIEQSNIDVANGVVGLLAGAVLILSGVGAGFIALNRSLKRFIKSTVLSATKQIHPESNGGRSLSDANMKLDKSLSNNAELLANQNALTQRFNDHLLTHSKD